VLKPLLTIKQTAERTERSTDFWRDEITRKRIAYHKIGGRYYIAEEDLNDYMTRARVAAYGERPVKR
jgi:excisionase family DNA binding protein